MRLSIMHHPSSTINNTIQHLSSTSILYIIHHHLSTTTLTSIHHTIQHHLLYHQYPPSNIIFCIIDIHHPASINNTNINQYHLLYHQLSRSTSINIHHQHVCISRFVSLYYWKYRYNITS